MAKQESGDAAAASPASTVTLQKRVLPARERRESATKREASELNLTIAAAKSSPSKKPTPTKQTPKKVPESKYVSKRKRDSISEVAPVEEPLKTIKEEPLPIKIVDSKALPTLPQPQSSKMPTSQYQSIAESAVLAAALHRSRSKWLVDGIFERYWTKPTKKKVAEGLPNQPDLKSMQKLGASTITVGPHTFEASIYMVRDTMPYRAPIPQPQRPVGIQPNFQSYQPHGMQQPVPQVRPSVPAAVTQASPEEKHVQIKIEDPSILGKMEVQKSALPQPTVSTRSSGSSSAAPDPVIKLLASRAANNPELKALMKVVASSKASPDQLGVFQYHIDELNDIIRRQQNTSRDAPDVQTSNAATQPTPPQINKPHVTPTNQHPTAQPSHPIPPVQPVQPAAPYPSTTLPSNAFQTKSYPGSRIGPLGPPLPQPITPSFPAHKAMSIPPKIPLPEPHIKAIVIEFLTPPPASATNLAPDRYLFPEYAVLDTPISGQGLEMVCSFFVVRKGSNIIATQPIDKSGSAHPVGGHTVWMPNEEYYQPVTLTIKTSHHKILETIARAAKPLPEVQKKMEEIMQTKTRVKDEWPALRLPRKQTDQLAGSVDGAMEIDS